MRNWEVFRPGLHNRKLFTPAELDRLHANFQAYSTGPNPWIPVRLKLGHDPKQLFATSVGLPSIGRAVEMVRTPGGGVAVNTSRMPAQSEYLDADLKPRVFDLLGKVRHGFYRGASIELPRGAPPPPPAARSTFAAGPRLVVRDEMPAPGGGWMRDGPYLDAIALLGDELPGCHGLAAPDVLTFAAAPGHGRIRIVCDAPQTFASPPAPEPPVDRNALNQQLTAAGMDPAQFAALSDEQVQQIIAIVGGDPTPPAAAPPATFATPAIGGDDLATRLANLEAAFKATQMNPADVKAVATFASTYQQELAGRHRRDAEQVVDAAIKAGRLLPSDRDDFVTLGLGKSQTQAFAAGDSRTQFAAWSQALAARPVVDTVVDLVTADSAGAELSAFEKAALNGSNLGRAALRAHAAA